MRFPYKMRYSLPPLHCISSVVTVKRNWPPNTDALAFRQGVGVQSMLGEAQSAYGRKSSGFFAVPFTVTMKWVWGPVEIPVLPTGPITSP